MRRDKAVYTLDVAQANSSAMQMTTINIGMSRVKTHPRVISSGYVCTVVIGDKGGGICSWSVPGLSFNSSITSGVETVKNVSVVG